MSIELLTFVMIATLLLALSLGHPLAFTLGGIAMIFTFFIWGPNGLYMAAATMPVAPASKRRAARKAPRVPRWDEQDVSVYPTSLQKSRNSAVPRLYAKVWATESTSRHMGNTSMA